MIGILLRRALLVLLFAALLAPVLEAFDSWDTTPGLASDTEFHVAMLATATGLLAAVAFAAVRFISPMARFGRLRPQPARAGHRSVAPLPLFSGTSPPRIPLRL
jgi:hypothetical protein